jgi:Uma2 family endonuclease
MATTIPRIAGEALSYEAYRTEGYVEGRYDIIEGKRIEMPGASWRHQEIAFRIAKQIDHYIERSGKGKVMMAPFDVLIRRNPRLQVRQPDVFYITMERLLRAGGIPDKGILETAPELVIEVISDSETQKRVDGKLQDYHEIGVEECWRVWPETQTIEVLKWMETGYQTVHVFGSAQSVQSILFPDLVIAVAAIFAS